MKKKFIALFLPFLVISCSEPVPDNYAACDRAYSDTARVSASKSVGDPRFRYSFSSGEF